MTSWEAESYSRFLLSNENQHGSLLLCAAAGLRLDFFKDVSLFVQHEYHEATFGGVSSQVVEKNRLDFILCLFLRFQLNQTLLGIFFLIKGGYERHVLFFIMLAQEMLVCTGILDDYPDPGIGFNAFCHFVASFQ
jgi:hypothetical protein